MVEQCADFLGLTECVLVVFSSTPPGMYLQKAIATTWLVSESFVDQQPYLLGGPC